MQHVAVVSRVALEGGLAPLASALLGGLTVDGFASHFVRESATTARDLEHVCGAILVHGHGTRRPVALLRDMPCVQVLGMPPTTGAVPDVVSYDYRLVGALAAEWLYDRGCRRLVAVIPNNAIGRGRGRDFREHAESLGCEAVVLEASGPAVHAAEADAAVAELLAMTPAADGLFAFNDHTLLALYPRLLRAGVDLDKLPMIGCDAEAFLPSLLPLPATINVHMPQLGRRASETLAWRLANPDARPVTVMLRPEVIEPEQLDSLRSRSANAFM